MRVFLFITLLSLSSCSFNPGADEEISILMGENDFYDEMDKMKNPCGVLPSYMKKTPGIITIDDSDCYEFFIFDNSIVLILMSLNPLCFIKMPSAEFYNHLKNELNNISAGRKPSEKINNSVASYKNIGDLHVELFFTPNEMKMANDFTIKDSDGIKVTDPSLLMAMSDFTMFYTPDFRDEVLYSCLLNEINSGKERVVYVKNACFNENNSSKRTIWRTVDNKLLNFTLIYGSGLHFSDGQMESLSPNIRSFALDDYALMFSVPLGNSLSRNESYLSKGESGKSGICLVFRGNISFIKKFLSGSGLNLKPGKIPISLEFKDDPGNGIIVNWGDAVSGVLSVSAIDGNPASVYYNVNGRSFCLNGLARGMTYHVDLSQGYENGDFICDGKVVFPELILTEVCYHGSSYGSDDGETNNDDWIEMKNTSNSVIDLKDYTLSVVDSSRIEKPIFSPEGKNSNTPINMKLGPGEYFVVYLRNDKFFSQYEFHCPENSEKRGTVTDNSIEKYCWIKLKRKEVLLSSVIAEFTAKSSPFKSIVLDSKCNWVESTNDSTVPMNSLEKYKNYCSPGYAAPGEL